MIMPVAEMHESFLHFYDKQSNFAAPEITAEEIDIYLNYAQEQFIKYLIEKGVEKSQEWVDYTRNLVTSVTITPAGVGSKPNSFRIALPTTTPGSEYRHSLLEEADITIPASAAACDGDTTLRVPVVPITRDEYAKAIRNPFRKPWREELLRITRPGDQFEIIAFPGCIVNTYYLDYLKIPRRIQYGSNYSPQIADVSCELEVNAAMKIIEMAVSFALQTIGDPRIATKQYDKLIKTV